MVVDSEPRVGTGAQVAGLKHSGARTAVVCVRKPHALSAAIALWNVNKMTFRPSAPLDEGRNCRATVGTGAKDVTSRR